MDKEYLPLLSRESQSLLSAVEKCIESEVIVKIDKSISCLACCIENYKPTIYTPSKERFLDDSVFHELLHFRRYCIEKIPRMILCDDYDPLDENFESGITKLDNNLEHFIIVPEEIKLRENRKSYWETRAEQRVKYLQPDLDALVFWAFSKYILPESDVFKEVDKRILKFDIRKQAEQLLSDILASLEDKEKLVRESITYSDIPNSSICLEYINFKDRVSNERPLQDIN